MIDFNDIKFTDTKNTIYIPLKLKNILCEFLHTKMPDAKFKTIPRWEIPNPFGLYEGYEKERNEFYRAHKDMFNGTEYENYPKGMWIGLMSKIDTDYLLEKLKLFYGDTKDEEVKEWEKENEQKLRIVVSAPDKSGHIILGLDSRKFEVIGNYDDVVAFRKLMDQKYMDQDEIRLILKSVAFKSITHE